MTNMRKWIRNKLNSESTENKSKVAYPTFLDLPGEIRNQIYSYAIYPNLSCITIVNCTKPEHFGAAVLRDPLFRVSRQIRAEALSYLCAAQTAKFSSLETALLFFSYVGSASSEVKTLVLAQLVLNDRSQKVVEMFFSVLETMSELSEVTLDKFAHITEEHEQNQCSNFIKRLEKLRERGIVVRVMLSTQRWI